MSSIANWTSLAVLLVLGCVYTAGRSQQLSVPEAIARSRLLSNVTKDASKVLLQHLTDIAQAPMSTPLRVVHELQHGRVVHALLQIMQTPRALDASNIEAWVDHLSTFLERYLHGVVPVQHGDVMLSLNHTAFSALPMMRRAILAHLAAGWLTTLKQRIPQPAQRKLAGLVRKLYRVHRESVVQKGVLEYFHISKAGGTSWNAAAKLNGCERARSAGSHVKGFGDECRWVDQSVYRNLTGRRILWGRWGHVSRATRYHGCRARYDYVVSRGFSYMSNEYTLQGGHESALDAHLCPQFVNVVTLREPLKRMESNIRFIMMHVKVAYGRRGDVTNFNQLFCNASADFWRALGPPITDNYLVRSFLGEDGFHSPVGSIGPDHLSAARDQLLQFDLVLDLDAGEEANDRAAQQGLGWSAALSAAHALDSSVLQQRMDLNYSTCHPEDAGMQQLRRAQGQDVRLYEFGRVVNQLDELWLDLARELEEKPEQLRCGMLHRGSNNSAWALAIERSMRRQGIASSGGSGGRGGRNERPKGGAGQLQKPQQAEEEEAEEEGMDGVETERDGEEADAVEEESAADGDGAGGAATRLRRWGRRSW